VSGADVRPLLANLPGLAPAADAARTLRKRAAHLRKSNPEDLPFAASHLRTPCPRELQGTRPPALLDGCSTKFMCRRHRESIWAEAGRILRHSASTGGARFSIVQLKSMGPIRSRQKFAESESPFCAALPMQVVRSRNIEPLRS
jgi:hypothetical protein